MSENKRPNQAQRVLSYMEHFGSINGAEAFTDLGVMHLPARIHELIGNGVPIRKKMVTRLNRYNEKVSFAQYSLAKEGE